MAFSAQGLSWMKVFGVGIAVFLLGTATLRQEVLRPRFGLPHFSDRPETVTPEVRRSWLSWGRAATVPDSASIHKPLPRHRPLRVVHIADLPVPETLGLFDQFVTEMQLLGPDLILATGDISYVETQAWYDTLRQRLSDTGIPVIAVAGNHERKDWPLWLRNYGSLNQHRVDAGPLTILSLDSIHGRDALTPATLRWLESELRSARAAGMTILIQAHHPIFPAGKDGKGEGHGSGGNLKGFQSTFVRLCRTYNVAAVLSGHWHQDAVFDLEGRLRDDTAEFPGTKFITTTTLGSEARLVTRWPHRSQGYRVLTIAQGNLVSYTQNPTGAATVVPMWSQPLGQIRRTDVQTPQGVWQRARIDNPTGLHLRGRLVVAGQANFPIDVPPRSTRVVPEEVQ